MIDKKLINTIYIISKGRPQCVTAKTLEKINYPGEWFIVCGNNDETLDEYKKRWGDRVIVFDWYEEIKHTDTMDNFGFETKASGACPVRNVVAEISRNRGEVRHWQLDDDYTHFQRTIFKNGEVFKNKKLNDGKTLEKYLYLIAQFGFNTNMPNVGFSLTTIESVPENWAKMKRRVFNAHNMINDPAIRTEWRSRINDDIVNAIETWRRGYPEYSVHFLQLYTKATQTEKGGLTEMYKADGTVRKTAYAIMFCPANVKLVINLGRYHHKVDWRGLTPKLISEKWR